jgi:hypothetical protein
VARIPFVLCTAAVQTVKDPEMAAQLERLGVRVILKPFDLEQLLGVLQEILATSPPREQQPWRTTVVRDLETSSGDGSQDHKG